MIGAREITAALGGRWIGAKGMARCPVHDDRRASLSIRDGEDGAIWFTCFAACNRRDIATELRRRGRLPDRGQQMRKTVVVERTHPLSDKALKLGRYSEPETRAVRHRRVERAIRVDLILEGIAAETIKGFRYG